MLKMNGLEEAGTGFSSCPAFTQCFAYAPSEIGKISPSAVLFGFGPDFVTKAGGDVSFISSQNRVRLLLTKLIFAELLPN